MAEINEGGCLCGSIRYRVEGDPVIGGACYCRHCQYTSGGSPAHGQMFPATALIVTRGTPSTFGVKAVSGNMVYRQFCPTCGVHVISWNSAAPEVRAIKIGTLDDPSEYLSHGSLWVSSAQPWHRPDPTLPQHPTMPCLGELGSDAN